MRNDELAIIRSGQLTIERSYRRRLPTLRDVFAVLFRQRWAFIISFALVIIAVTVSGVWIPKYEARMKILVQHQRPDSTATPAADAPDEQSNDQAGEEDLKSEVELLKGNDLMQKVVLSTGLSGTPASPTAGEPEETTVAAARRLSKELQIEPLHKTNMISVSYQARDPHTAERVLKALADAYTEKHEEMQRSSKDFKFFDQEAEHHKQVLNDAQEKLTEFTKGTGVVSAQLERDAALQQSNAFNSTAGQAQTEMREAEQRVLALQAKLETIKPRVTTVVRESDNQQLLEQLRSSLFNLEMKRTELLTKYEPTYRLVQEVDQQIVQAKNAISTAESKPSRDESSDQNPDYQWVQAELTKAQADLSGLRARAAAAATVAAKFHAQAQSLDGNMVTQQNLMQIAKTEEENYLLYAHKREEARISSALDKGGIVNVSVAEPPVAPSLPKRSPLNVAFLTLLLAGTFSLSTAFVIDSMDPTFRTPDELVGYLGVPVLTALPKGRE